MRTRSFIKTTMLALLVGGLTLGVLAAEKKASPTGTWKWSFSPPGGDPINITLKLKADGEKLTGTITGRDGTETAIQDGKVTGAEVSFKVVRERNGQKFTSKYAGKLEGDIIKGKIEMERDGQTNSRDWEAKRAKE